ncbi:CoA-acylating methylmalonate-semialdehyde dehydrogenase [uncultured Tateyamaria sp.]|uniref:CoA-acylating methylmalonate-semialdehyde dehydrogenase n=1 Tax=uncultured Tateyamaria sp. TaxID=455651 RepID=UPI00262BD064|nr:CoA-acylating methylmalonate-semialdehyde dehydrogenase [uncultured Tateyamaria sp.]
MNEIPQFTGNTAVSHGSDRTAPVFDPATGQQTKTVALATAAEVSAAVLKARTAWPEWARMSPLRRARILDRFKSILWERAETLAEVISSEHGKTHDDALGEVTRGIEVVEFATGAPHLLKGEVSENVGTAVDSYSLRQPLGVVAGITPFNFPAMVPMWMFPVALACGNTFVLKPSERVPSASLLLAEWLSEAGLPDGVFNVVQGDKEAVDALLEHPDVKAVSFVGSTPIAKYIHAKGTANGKRVQALGGAKNHMVILPDADLDQAANALMGAAFGSAGERCMAISVAVPVTDAVADALVERLVPMMEKLRVGPATDRSAEMGPVVSEAARKRIVDYIGQGEAAGAKVVLDGRRFIPPQGHENGYFVGPTLLDHVTPDMSVWKDEIFGPVLSVVRRNTYAGAVELVQAHEYANGVAIFTRDGDAARAFSHEIEVGMVGVNVPLPVPVAFHSFGGWKQSLFGDHHMHGMEGVRFYTRMKAITTRWPTGVRSGPEFAMPTLG